MIRKITSLLVALGLTQALPAQSTLSSFTTDSSITGVEYVIGYQTATAGGERKFLLGDMRVYMAATSQPLDADLTTYAGITPSSNTQTLLASADYAAWRSNLNLTIGTNVQAYDADLTTWAGVTPGTGVSAALSNDLDASGGVATVGGTALAAKRDNINAGVAITVTEASPDTATLTWTDGKWRTLALDEATTLSYTAPSAGDSVTMQITGHTADVVLTVPTTYSEAFGGNRTAWTIPANSVVTVTLRYDGTSYRSYGDPVPNINYYGTPASPNTSGAAVSVTVSGSLWGAECYVNTAQELDLETVANWADKYVAIFNMGTNTITIDPAGSEVIYLEGVALSGGDRITIGNTAGSFVVLKGVAGTIVVWGSKGAITDAN